MIDNKKLNILIKETTEALKVYKGGIDKGLIYFLTHNADSGICMYCFSNGFDVLESVVSYYTTAICGTNDYHLFPPRYSNSNDVAILPRIELLETILEEANKLL